MQYRVAAYKCKVNSVIEVNDDMIPLGGVLIGEDIFAIFLDPLEERNLPEEKEDVAKPAEEQGSD